MGSLASDEWGSAKPGSQIHIPRYALYGEEVWTNELDGLHIEPLGIRVPGGGPIDPHRHPELFQFSWIRSGRGLIDIDGSEFDLVDSHLILLPPMITHGFRFKGQAAGYTLMASSRLLREVVPAEDFALIQSPGLITPAGQLRDEIHACFETTAEEVRKQRSGRRSALIGSVLRIVSLILGDQNLSRVSGGLASAEADLLERFLQLVEQHFWDHIGLNDYCDKLGVTPGRLSRACRIASGKPPLRLIQNRLLLAAKRKLVYTALSVSEIAFELGFNDPAYFSRFFSKHEGLSPALYRHHRKTVT